MLRIWLLAGLASAATASDVVQLTEATFDEHISGKQHVLVQFFAPWCGHCKKLLPEYEAAAEQLQRKGVSLCKVDATAEKAVASKYNVKGFPTLIWFEGGERSDYDGGRSTDGIIDWVNSMIGPPVLEAESAEAIQQPADMPLIVLTAEAMLEAFESEAKRRRRKAAWYFVKASSGPKVSISHKDEEPLVLEEGLPERLPAFVEENMLPLFGSLDAETYDKYIEAPKGLVWCLFPSGERGFEALHEHYRPILSEVARKVREKYLVTITDTEKFKEALENMLGLTSFPALAVQKRAGEKRKFVYTGEITAEKVAAFIADVDNDQMQPSLRSDPVPEPSDAPVKVVVASTMEKEVFTPDKDVMLEIYAPWCGHCKKLEPEYIKLAKKIRKEELTDLITVAKMDGTKNDSPVDAIEWTTFPTIYFVRAGQSEVVLYDGERTAKGLWKYIRKNATKALEIKDRLERKKGGAKQEEL